MINFRVFYLSIIVPVVLDGAFLIRINCTTPLAPIINPNNPPQAIATIVVVSSFFFEISGTDTTSKLHVR